MLSPFQQALGNAKLAIASLSVMLGVSLFLNIMLGISLANAPKDMRVLLNQVPKTGLSVKYGEVAPISVYQMAQNVWESLNTWQQNAVNDAPDTIMSLLKVGYITPNFSNQYTQILDEYKQQGLTDDYKLITQPMHGVLFDPDDVKPYHNGWQVRLKMTSLFYYNADLSSLDNKNNARLTPQQRFNQLTNPLASKPIKSITAEYILVVTPAPNDTGLAIDGLYSGPKILADQTNLGGAA
jgi:hypothetical protein